MATSVASQNPAQKPVAKNGVPCGRSADVFSIMRAEMDRVLQRFTHAWPDLPTLSDALEGDILLPTLDVKDTGKSIVIDVELPGVDDKDVSLSLKDRVLTIKGEKRQSKEEKGENRYVMERSYGSFVRSVQLPASIDESKIEARFGKGVLTVTAEKKPGTSNPEKRIEIRQS